MAGHVVADLICVSAAKLPHVPFNDDGWLKFLRENALRVLGLVSSTVGG